MNALHATLDRVAGLGTVERIGWALLQSLWEGALVAAVLAAVLLILRRKSARVRYGVACTAMALAALLPIATASWIMTLPGPEPTPAPPIENVRRAAVPIASHAEPPTVGAPAAAVTIDRLPMLLRAVSLAWLAGVVGFSGLNLLGWTNVQLLRRRSAGAPAAWQQRLDRDALALGLGRSVVLRLSERVSAPALIGWLRPMVLVPASALTELPAAHLEALLLHELAHIRRHDYLINLLQTVLETLLFYHPAVWWIGHKIRQERENCCDDIAAAHCGSRLIYAKALAAMEGLRAGRLPAWALGSNGGALLRRIERLVAPNSRPSRWRVSPAAASLLLIAALALLAPIPRSGAVPVADKPVSAAGPRSRPTAATRAVRPEDLEPGQPTDYRISPNDLLAITLSDLNGPNSQTVKQSRVSEEGKISLPYLDKPIQAAGFTEFGLEQAIIKAYREAGLIAHAQVSVTIVEARGRAISIIGAVNKPGEYLLQQNAVRLLDALALAGGVKPDTSRIGVLRGDHVVRQGTDIKIRGNASMIDVPADRLLAGDEKQNIVVRPGDTIVVSATPFEPAASVFVRLVVGRQSLRFNGRDVTWDQVADAIQKLPDRANTVLELAVESDDVPVGRFFEAQTRAGALVSRYGLRYLSMVGTETAARKADTIR